MKSFFSFLLKVYDNRCKDKKYWRRKWCPSLQSAFFSWCGFMYQFKNGFQSHIENVKPHIGWQKRKKERWCMIGISTRCQACASARGRRIRWEKKDKREMDGRVEGYCRIWIRKGLMEGERGVVRNNWDEQATKTGGPGYWQFHLKLVKKKKK